MRFNRDVDLLVKNVMEEKNYCSCGRNRKKRVFAKEPAKKMMSNMMHARVGINCGTCAY